MKKMIQILKKIFKKKEETKSGMHSMNLEKRFQKAMDILEKHKRKAYFPVIKEQSPTFSIKSKMGGYPYLRHEKDWPVCPNCKKNRQLFLQLNLEDLPKGKKEKGIVQLFYCTNNEPLCDDDLEAFLPFSKAVVCRKIQPKGQSIQIQPKIDEVYKEKLILDWVEKDDYPHTEEYKQQGIDLELDDDVYELMDERQTGMPLEKDKLFGWPYWIQSVEYPLDRKTGKQMELLFQIDSEDNLPFMFGDSGIGHLTQSPDDENELGFGWACC